VGSPQVCPGVIISNLVTWVWTGSAYVVPSAMAKGGGACHDHVARGSSGALKAFASTRSRPGRFQLKGAWDKLNPLAETGVGATQADEVPLRRVLERWKNCAIS